MYAATQHTYLKIFSLPSLQKWLKHSILHISIVLTLLQSFAQGKDKLMKKLVVRIARQQCKASDTVPETHAQAQRGLTARSRNKNNQ